MKSEAIKRLFIDKTGKFFRYQKETHEFIRHEMNDRLIKIITDKKTIVILLEDFEDRSIEWIAEPATQVELSPAKDYSSNPTNVMLMNSNSLITNKGIQIADILMENITKVRSDKDFVPQAEAINNSVKAFIDLAKVEVEMIKVSRG